MKLKDRLKYNPLNQLYDEAQMPAKIRRSLNFILLGNIFGSAHGIICGGGTTAMIGLATELGANDMAFGILAAIPQVAALLQLPYSVLVNRTHKRKKYMLTLGIFSRALWLLFGLIPFLLPMASATVQLWTIIFLIGVSACCGSVINVCWFPWLSDLTPMQIRGRWLSIRESILAAANVLIGLVVAYALDSLPPDIRYVIIFLIGGTVGVLDMIAFAPCEEVYSAPPQKQNLFKAFGEVLKNKPFMNLVIMWTFWCFTANMSGVYLNPYSMNEMGLSFMQIMIFSTIAASVVAIFVMPAWGRMIDRFGCRNVMMVACFVASMTPLFYLLSRPGSIWPTLLHNTIGAMFWCGSNLTANNMQLSCSPNETRPTHIAVFSCVTALAGGTLGSLAGGALLESWNQANLFTTGPLDRYKVLFIVAVVLRLTFTLIFVPRFAKDNEASPKDLVRHIAGSVFGPLVGRRGI
ncbi:MAG: MFS transporter [Clostridia bacterium]|nr:MFS transporter [Clostridia bacterium]